MLLSKIDKAYTLLERLTQSEIEPLNDQSKSKEHNYEFISDVEIFNRLMFELAKYGKTNQITEIFRKMRTNPDPAKQLRPNLNSFIAVIQSIGYELNNSSDDKKHRLTLERVLYDIKKSNVNFFNFKI